MALDSQFEPTARLVVREQIGSTSFIQRRLNRSYSRSIHVMSLLELSGAVGPLVGINPREVLVKNETELEAVIKAFKESFYHTSANRREPIPSSVQEVNHYKPIVDKHIKDYPSYVGVYQFKVGELDTVFVKDGKLFDKGGGGDTYDFAVNDNEYMFDGDLTRLSFGRDAKGVVSYYTITNQDGQHWKCPKIK